MLEAKRDNAAASKRKLYTRLKSLVKRARSFRHVDQATRWDEVDSFRYAGSICLKELYGDDAPEVKAFNRHIGTAFDPCMPLDGPQLVLKSFVGENCVEYLNRGPLLWALRILIRAARKIEGHAVADTTETEREPGYRASENTTRVESVAQQGAALLNAYKSEGAGIGIRITDKMIAEAACETWHDRTPVQRWKRNDPRCTPGDDYRIRAVLKAKPHLKQKQHMPKK